MAEMNLEVVNCKSCRFFEWVNAGDGLCRRFPPQVRVWCEDEKTWFWESPVVGVGDWCGEFKHKEGV